MSKQPQDITFPFEKDESAEQSPSSPEYCDTSLKKKSHKERSTKRRSRPFICEGDRSGTEYNDRSPVLDRKESFDNKADSVIRHCKRSGAALQFLQSQNQPEQGDKFKMLLCEMDVTYQQQMLEENEHTAKLTNQVAHLSAKSNINCIEKIPVSAWQRELIPHCIGTFDDCDVFYCGTENVVLIIGSEEKVSEHRVKMVTELRKLKEEALALTPATRSVLSSEKGMTYLKSVIDSDQSNVRAFLQDGSLVLVAKGTDVLASCLDKLKLQLNYVETTKSGSDLPLTELISLQAKLERDLLVVVSWNDDGKQIVVEGIKDDVLLSKKYVEQLIEKHEVHEKVLETIESYQPQMLEMSAKPNIYCKEKIPVSAWQCELVPHCFGTFDDCEVFYSDTENVALIFGPEEKVLEHQLKVLTELKKFKEEALALTPATRFVLSSEKGMTYLESVIDSGKSNVRTFLQDGSLVLVAKETDVLASCLDKLKLQLNYVETTKSGSDLPLTELISLQAKLERDLLVVVSWNDDGKQIVVEGIKDDVLLSKKYVEQLIEEHIVYEKIFDVKDSLAKLLNRYYSERIKSWLENLEISDSDMTDSHISLKFKGNKNQVQEAHRKLQELETQIQSKSWTLKSEFRNSADTMLIEKGFDSEDVKYLIEHFEMKEKCLVIPHFTKTDFSPVQANKSYLAKSKGADESDRMPFPSQRKSKLCLSVTGNCQLVITPYGNITKESSDVLVCILDQKSMDLKKTRVGQAFNKACPSLQKDIQAQQKAHPKDTVLVTRGSYSPLKCKAICHVILFPWNPDTSPRHLTNAINCVLTKAAALGAQSVSFPALGCGKAFGFPASKVAQIFLSCIDQKAISIDKGIKKIVVLASDQELFKQFKDNALGPTSFGAAADSDLLGAVGGVPKCKNTDKDGCSSDEDDFIFKSDEDSKNESDEEDRVDGEDDSNARYDFQTEQTTNDAQICLMALHGKPLRELWSILKDKIKEHCLHVEHFTQDIFGKHSTKRIAEKAEELCVQVRRSGRPGYSIKGTKKNVEKMMRVIMEEYYSERSNISSKAPKRGTVQFLKYAAAYDVPYPSYWSLSEKKGLWTKALDMMKKEEYIVEVDSKTKDAIKKLIAQTWNKNLVGLGKDAEGLRHSDIQVINVLRIENPHLFEQYRAQRKRMLAKTAKTGKLCPDMGKLTGSRGRVMTTERLDDFMREELYWEINEHYLFHGTKAEAKNALINNGIDPRVSNQDAMFGKGIYTAEEVTKSDQYTDSRSARTRNGTELYLILSRVLLGNVFLCDDSHPSVVNRDSVKLTRPPCVHCLQDKCGCRKQRLFDSVMGDGKWMFREFVVYEMNQCYPEYLIKYKRV